LKSKSEVWVAILGIISFSFLVRLLVLLNSS